MLNMYRIVKPVQFVQNRPFKKFGHKREPEAIVTVLWQGFLTLTFIGLGIEWKSLVTVSLHLGPLCSFINCAIFLPLVAMPLPLKLVSKRYCHAVSKRIYKFIFGDESKKDSLLDIDRSETE